MSFIAKPKWASSLWSFGFTKTLEGCAMVGKRRMETNHNVKGDIIAVSHSVLIVHSYSANEPLIQYLWATHSAPLRRKSVNLWKHAYCTTNPNTYNAPWANLTAWMYCVHFSLFFADTSPKQHMHTGLSSMNGYDNSQEPAKHLIKIKKRIIVWKILPASVPYIWRFFVTSQSIYGFRINSARNSSPDLFPNQRGL